MNKKIKSTTNGSTIRRLNKIVALVALVCSSQAMALPAGFTPVTPGVTGTLVTPTQYDITTTAAKSIATFTSFNTAVGETVNISQPSAVSAFLARISGPLTTFSGTLNSNGSVYLINPNGIAMGNGSVMNVAGLVLSTADIADVDFLADINNFQLAGVGNINLNGATINTLPGGFIHLIGKNVTVNNTSLNADTISLVAAKDVRYSSIAGAPDISNDLTNTGSISVAGTSVVTALNGKIFLKTHGNASIGGTLTAGKNNTGSVVDIQADGSVTSSTGTLRADNLTIKAVSSVSLIGKVDTNVLAVDGGLINIFDSINNSIASIDHVIGSGSSVSVNNGVGAMTINGAVSAANGAVTVNNNGGATHLTSTGSIVSGTSSVTMNLKGIGDFTVDSGAVISGLFGVSIQNSALALNSGNMIVNGSISGSDVNLSSINGISVGSTGSLSATNMVILAATDNTVNAGSITAGNGINSTNYVGAFNNTGTFDAGAGAISVLSDSINLGSTGVISSNAAGDAIIFDMWGNSVNTFVGGGTINTPNGRWLAYQNSFTNNLGGLTASNLYGQDSLTIGTKMSTDLTSTGGPNFSTGNWVIHKLQPTLSVAAVAGQTSVYGNAPVLGTVGVASGLVNGDATAYGSGTAAFSTPAISTSNVGAYDVAYTSGYASATGYLYQDNTAVVNELSVTPAALQLAVNGTKVTGQAATFGNAYVTSGAFVGTDSLASFGGTAVKTDLTPLSAIPSNYVGGASLSGYTSNNYTLAYVNGDMLVTAATVVVPPVTHHDDHYPSLKDLHEKHHNRFEKSERHHKNKEIKECRASFI